MDTLLAALDRRATPLQKLYITGLFFICISSFLVAAHLLHLILGIDKIDLQLLTWIGWFYWQGNLFPRNRIRYIQLYPTNPYKAAFYKDILIGVSLGVSQMLKPGFYGFLETDFSYPWPVMIMALGFIVVGLSLMYAGFSTIGFAGAGFYHEYKPIQIEQKILKESIYASIRHPLFLGGVMASFGSSLLFSIDTLFLGLMNIAVLPIYKKIEDQRQTDILGEAYLAYTQQVGGFIPKSILAFNYALIGKALILIFCLFFL